MEAVKAVDGNSRRKWNNGTVSPEEAHRITIYCALWNADEVMLLTDPHKCRVNELDHCTCCVFRKLFSWYLQCWLATALRASGAQAVARAFPSAAQVRELDNAADQCTWRNLN